MAGSKLYYWSAGAWVQETNLATLQMIDEVNHPFTITATVADPKNVKNDLYTPGMPLQIEELVSGAVLWQGSVVYAETSHSAEGQIITVTGVDDLNELIETTLDVDMSNRQALNTIMIGTIAAGTYHDISYDTLVGSIHVGFWLKGRLSGVKAQVCYNYGGKVSIRNVESLTASSQFWVGETVDEFLEERCTPSDLAAHFILFGNTNFNVTAYNIGKLDPIIDAGLHPSTLSTGPILIGSNQVSFEFLTEMLEYGSEVTGLNRYGCVLQAKRKNDTSSYAEIFYRDKYTGMEVWSLTQYNGGVTPANPSMYGLTIAYGEADPGGYQWIAMSGDYQFGYPNPKEMATRVVVHYAGTDQSGQVAIVTNSSIEVALGVSREHNVYAYWIMDASVALELAGYIAEQMNNPAGILRGSCSIARWPQFVKSGSRYFVRAGHTIHMHHSLIPAVNEKSLIVRKITYTEPSCLSTIEFIDNYYGLLGSFPTTMTAMIKKAQRDLVKTRHQSLATAGLLNDRVAPVKPTGTGPGDHIVGVSGPGVINLSWNYGSEADLKYYNVARDTDPAFGTSPEHYLGLVAANVFVDGTGVKGVDYYFRIYAIDLAGNVSPPSDIIGPLQLGAVEALPIGTIYTSIDPANPATILGYGTWSAFGSGRVPVGYAAGDPDFGTVEGTGGAKTVTLDASMIPAHVHTSAAHTHTSAAHVHTSAAHTHQVDPPNTISTGSGGHEHTPMTYLVDDFGGVNDGFAATDTSGIPATWPVGAVGNHTHNVDISEFTSGSTTPGDTGSTTPGDTGSTTPGDTGSVGGGGAHANLQPFIVVYMWKRLT